MEANISAASLGWADSPSASAAPVLPKLARARGGAEFDPSADRWSWRDSLSTVSLDFAPFCDLLAPQLIAALKTTLIWYAEVHSPNTLGVRQNRAYDHVSDRDVLALVREAEGVVAKPMFGPVAKVYRGSLIPRDEFDRLKLLSAHTTDYGYCVHDFTMLPCQQHMDCVNCEEEVCIKGQDPEKEANIRQLQRETAHLLKIAREAMEEGDAGADRWVEHQQLTLARADQLCAILDDERVPAGAVIRLSNLEAPSRIEDAQRRRLEHPAPRPQPPGPEGLASRQSSTSEAGAK